MQGTLTDPDERPSVVIVGAGFGSLRVARGLRGAPFDVTVLDQRNYHTFIPLLYQVATAGLEPEEIAQPIRRILRGAVRFLSSSVREASAPCSPLSIFFVTSKKALCRHLRSSSRRAGRDR